MNYNNRGKLYFSKNNFEEIEKIMDGKRIICFKNKDKLNSDFNEDKIGKEIKYDYNNDDIYNGE